MPGWTESLETSYKISVNSIEALECFYNLLLVVYDPQKQSHCFNSC